MTRKDSKSFSDNAQRRRNRQAVTDAATNPDEHPFRAALLGVIADTDKLIGDKKQEKNLLNDDLIPSGVVGIFR